MNEVSVLIISVLILVILMMILEIQGMNEKIRHLENMNRLNVRDLDCYLRTFNAARRKKK